MVYQELETWQNRIRGEALSKIDWLKCRFFTEDTIPEGRWGTNSLGNDYLAVDDESFYYFNADGSVYRRNPPPAPSPSTPSRIGSSLYISPTKSLHYTPSSQEQDQDGGKYFIGYDWKTDERLYYWDNGEGIIVRSLKKNIDFSAQVEYYDVQTYTNKDGVERVIIVDEDGNCVGKNKVIMEELENLPEEDPVNTPMTPSQETVIYEVDIKLEITIKTEESLSLITPIDSHPSTPAEEDDEHEEVGEDIPEAVVDDAEDAQLHVTNAPSIEGTPAVPMSKEDSQSRNSRITRSAAASSFPYRVMKANVQKRGK